MFEATFTTNNGTFISVTAAGSWTKEHMVRVFQGESLTIATFPNKKAALAAVKLLMAA